MWTSLCSFDELVEGKGKYAEVGGFQLAIFLDQGQVSVIDNTCPHAGGNLAGGFIDAGCAVCPWHYWAFRLDNGELRDAPGIAVTKYEVRLHPHEGKTLVQVDLPSF